jgi:hypothetical protein
LYKFAKIKNKITVLNVAAGVATHLELGFVQSLLKSLSLNEIAFVEKKLLKEHLHKNIIIPRC